MVGKPEHPGRILKERFLGPLGLKPSDLAREIGVRPRRISELVLARRRLTPDIAFRLAEFFDVPARWWLEMQARFDADDPGRAAQLRNVVRRYRHLDRFIITPSGARHLGPQVPRSPAPLLAEVSDEFLARLRSHARLSNRSLKREPRVITFDDGTRTLTGE